MNASANRNVTGTSDTTTGPVDVNPGDQAPPGTPQSGERICPRCGGAGRQASGARCEFCGGTGRVIELVGDA
jgi:DnaJ-class molecular chaperone